MLSKQKPEICIISRNFTLCTLNTCYKMVTFNERPRGNNPKRSYLFVIVARLLLPSIFRGKKEAKERTVSTFPGLEIDRLKIGY